VKKKKDWQQRDDLSTASQTERGKETHANGLDHELDGLAALDKARGQDTGREDQVALAELLEEHAVGVALAANADALQHTVAAELVKHQRRVDLAGALDVVGDDATHKVRVCAVEREHELRQLVLRGSEVSALLRRNKDTNRAIMGGI
jgi:hypothetical protein